MVQAKAVLILFGYDNCYHKKDHVCIFRLPSNHLVQPVTEGKIMGKSIRSGALCKFSKSDIKDHFDELVKLTSKSRYLCGKCARSALEKKRLCKPLEM